MMKKSMLIIVMGVMLTMFATCFAATKPKVQLLYVLHARQGVIKQIDAKQYQATLSHVTMTAFTDRPYRKVARVLPSDFVINWAQGENSFAKDNPNAAVIAGMDMRQADQDMNSFVVLSKPQYDAKTQQMSFTMTPLKTADTIKAGVFQDFVLFIDSGINGSSIGFGNL